ncbi:uncharacterized protein LOC115880084 [Sitophilus oryzae]|uniref:Uncharacterized protein LOC115880084 n=1 Tax=Sitophilus oryzae TaxID=7048 RepID=A0A6J2XQE9_SITOR|nr:uncharacterized protein LOC115880084 [Sitophilus oryzae]
MTPSCPDDNNLVCTSTFSNTAPANTLSLLANNLSLHSEKYQIGSLIRPNVDNNHFYTIAVEGEVNPPMDFRKHFFQFTEPPRQPSNSANCLDPSRPVISTQVSTNDSLQRVLNRLTPEVRDTHWFFSLLDIEDNLCQVTMPVKWIPKQKRNAHNLMKNAHLFANRKSKICKFCFTNGEAKDIFSSHVIKSKQGETICPILRKHKCEICGATGIHAHTKSHCPLNKKQKIRYHKLVHGCLKP